MKLRLWEIVKLISENKIEEETYFINKNNASMLLVYKNNLLLDIVNNNAVIFDVKYLKEDYKMITPDYKKVKITCRKTVEINNGIGFLDDEYIDSIYVIMNYQTYEIVPINGQFAIPKVKEGKVDVYYFKYAEGKSIKINSNEIEIY